MELEKKKNEKRGVGCKKGGCCVLSTSTCDPGHWPSGTPWLCFLHTSSTVMFMGKK